MNLYNRILKLRQTVLSSDFDLYDDSDGKGPYIKYWRSVLAKPTAAEIASVDDTPPAPTALEQIAALEASVTPRRVRDAITGAAGGVAWLASIETQIAALRLKL